MSAERKVKAGIVTLQISNEIALSLDKEVGELRAKIERLERALIEIEYHSTDKNAAATARAALAQG